MKVEKKMQVEIEHGTVQIAWDSERPQEYTVSIDQSGDDRCYVVKRDSLIFLREAIDRALAEETAAVAVLRTNAARPK